MDKRAARLAVTAALIACTALPIGAQPHPPDAVPADRVLRESQELQPTARESIGIPGVGILGLLLAVGLALGLPAVLVIRRWDWQQRGRLEGADQPPTTDPPEWSAPSEPRPLDTRRNIVR